MNPPIFGGIIKKLKRGVKKVDQVNKVSIFRTQISGLMSNGLNASKKTQT
jgi:hypothetical protein